MKYRTVVFFKTYFTDFLSAQRQKVKDKTIWTLRVIEEIYQVPEIYLKHIEGTDGLYEVRVQSGSDSFRIFCFFDDGNLVILMNGFQKKTQKTPKAEIEKAIRIRELYYEEK